MNHIILKPSKLNYVQSFKTNSLSVTKSDIVKVNGCINRGDLVNQELLLQNVDCVSRHSRIGSSLKKQTLSQLSAPLPDQYNKTNCTTNDDYSHCSSISTISYRTAFTKLKNFDSVSRHLSNKSTRSINEPSMVAGSFATHSYKSINLNETVQNFKSSSVINSKTHSSNHRNLDSVSQYSLITSQCKTLTPTIVNGSLCDKSSKTININDKVSTGLSGSTISYGRALSNNNTYSNCNFESTKKTPSVWTLSGRSRLCSGSIDKTKSLERISGRTVILTKTQNANRNYLTVCKFIIGVILGLIFTIIFIFLHMNIYDKFH